MRPSRLATSLVFMLVGALASWNVDAVEIVSSSESTPHPGVRIVEGRTSNPATSFYAAYVSLCSDYIHVEASEYDGLNTSAAWAGDVGVELAVNGDFYTTSGTYHVYGDAVGNGARWAANRTGRDSAYSADWYYQRYGWIAFGNRWVEHSSSELVKQQGLSQSGWKPGEVTTSIPPGTLALVSGFPQIVIDGAAVACSSPTESSCFPDRTDMRSRHPRTAMGLSRDRKTFLLLVVDGRTSGNAGMYGSELAELMEELGAWQAFNLDGGGSSQMWVSGSGTVNDPSGGSPRSVMNHWGIFAGSGNGLPTFPGNCDLSYDGLVHQFAGRNPLPAVDLNADGRADVCIRGPEGIQCALANDAGFGAVFDGPALADSSGWADPSNYATLRMGDVDGDGRSDLCARADAGMRCWRSTGGSFESSIVGPDLSDSNGFFRDALFTTIRLADVTGDGRADICARHADGFRCYPSTGDGFGAALEGPSLSDASGWNDPGNYGTIRMGDIDGDGRADVCARGNAGMFCWLAEGGFETRLDGPLWSDEAGWSLYRHWSSIQLVDLDGDGRHDLCGRGPGDLGLVCHLSVGGGFGPAIDGLGLLDSSGWQDPSNFETLRFADVTGDGLLDACARANGGIRCWPFDGAAFATVALTGELTDAQGWDEPQYYRTIELTDIDGDGLADVCGRGARSILCLKSTGTGFGPEEIAGPAWSNANGFDAPSYYGTTLFSGPGRPALPDPVEPEPELGPEPIEHVEDPADTAPDSTHASELLDLSSDETSLAEGTSLADAPSFPTDALTPDFLESVEVNPADDSVEGACGCRSLRQVPGKLPGGVGLVALFLFVSVLRRRPL